MIVDLVADFLEELFGDWHMPMTSRKRLYTVEWSKFTGLEPDDRTFQLKAKSPEDAIRKVYKKIFTREDRKKFLLLSFAPNGEGLVHIVNTNRSGELIGDLIITEE